MREIFLSRKGAKKRKEFYPSFTLRSWRSWRSLREIFLSRKGEKKRKYLEQVTCCQLVVHYLKSPRLFEKYIPARQINPEMVNESRMAEVNKVLSASLMCVPEK